MSENPPNGNMIAALLRERESLVARKLDDRVAQVDEQLEHYGYTGDPASAGEGASARMASKPTGRKPGGPRSTAAADS